MTRQPVIARRAEALLDSAVIATAPVAGGDIATATKLRLADGTTALMKTHPRPPEGFFAAEMRGLRWLGAVEAGVPVPEVLAGDDECVILRWVEQGKPGAEAATAFGTALAATHAAGAPGYGAVDDAGAHTDGFIGRLPLANRGADSWAEFYAERRVLPYLRLGRDRGSVTEDQVSVIESVLPRLAELVPEEGPARVHGDLWNGNVLWGHDGHAHIIDPAAHGGHRETDLAMLSLFGLPQLAKVLDAYDATAPLGDGWRDRVGLHQLHPLLVHACLFGGGYAARAAAVVSAFA